MAITTAMATSFKNELFTATHDEADVYKISLYTSSATLGASTTAYSATNEVTGTGYTAGGAILAGYTAGTSGTTAWLDWTDPTWTTSTITARGAMIYNSSKSNKCVAVFDFGSDITSTADTFTAVLPAADASNAVIRIA